MKRILVEQNPVAGVEGALDSFVALVVPATLDQMIGKAFVTDDVGLVERTDDQVLGVGTGVNVHVIDIRHRGRNSRRRLKT